MCTVLAVLWFPNAYKTMYHNEPLLHHYFFLWVLATYIAVNIQPADRLRLLGGVLLLYSDSTMDKCCCSSDLSHQRHRHRRECCFRNWILERPLFGQYEVLMDQLMNSELYGYINL